MYTQMYMYTDTNSCANALTDPHTHAYTHAKITQMCTLNHVDTSRGTYSLSVIVRINPCVTKLVEIIHHVVA